MSSRAESIRRGTPISAYVGANGGGKTYCAVRDVILSLEADKKRKVLSTVEIDHPRYEKLTSWVQILDAYRCEVLLDEVTGVASARSYASLPAELLNRMVQLRKADVRLRWTTPNFARADVVIREVTRAVTYCHGSLGPMGRHVDDDGTVTQTGWREHKLFRFSTYDAQEFEEFELQKRDTLRKLGFQAVWRGKNDRFAAMYNTLGSVSVLDHVDLTGACLECGGQRPRKKCSCVSPSHGRSPAKMTTPPVVPDGAASSTWDTAPSDEYHASPN